MKENTTILLVGGAGYIGSHVNKLLNKKGYTTIVFDNLVYGHREFVKWGEFVLGDLGDKEQVRLCFKRYKIDAVMHFSAYAYVGESVINPSVYYNNNVVNTLNLLDVMLEFRVKYLIFSSSCAVYGIPVNIPIKEEHPQNPISPYGKSKLMIEQILEDYDKAYGIRYISLRYFNAAGADPECDIGEWHDPETHLIPIILDVALGNKDSLIVYGNDYDTYDGTCIRDYIHVCDIAKAHVLALEYLFTTDRSDIFNLGSGRGFSVKEIINAVQRVTGKTVHFKIANRRPGDPPILIADASKARKVLGWEPEFNNLYEIIETAWNWQKKLRRG